jgi:phosphohistidine phosphatase SixA
MLMQGSSLKHMDGKANDLARRLTPRGDNSEGRLTDSVSSRRTSKAHLQTSHLRRASNAAIVTIAIVVHHDVLTSLSTLAQRIRDILSSDCGHAPIDPRDLILISDLISI